MLTALSIRDVVLIERLDLSFGRGLTVLTGETGAGKSILLDSLGLALGARADAGLVRAGAEQASVTACFAPPAGHPARAARRTGTRGGGRGRAAPRADQGWPVARLHQRPAGRRGAAAARGALLVEVQGQHEQIGLADPASHAALLDAFGVARSLRDAAAAAWRAWRAAVAALEAAREAIAAAERDEEWLRHAVEELAGLAPQPGEEERLAQERQRLQQGERHAEAIAAALSELAPHDRRGSGPAAALRAASPCVAAAGDAGASLRRPIRPGRRSPRWNGRRRRWPRRKAF